MSSAEMAAEKRRLRATARARRAAAHARADAHMTRRLAAHGLDFIEPAPGTIVSGFMPLAEEIDVVPLLTWLAAEGLALCLPVVQGKDRPLLFRTWTPGDELRSAVWGIREPHGDKAVLTPDIMLVPLLAFDRHGWRLGYGGGYYDRTIASLQTDRLITTVGIAYDEQEIDAVPHLDYDEPLDWVLTPSGPRRFALL